MPDKTRHEELRRVAGLATRRLSAAREAFDAYGESMVTVQTMIEAYDELESALDTFEGIKDEERYEGKSDDLEEAWEEVTTAMESLADAAEELGLS